MAEYDDGYEYDNKKSDKESTSRLAVLFILFVVVLYGSAITFVALEFAETGADVTNTEKMHVKYSLNLLVYTGIAAVVFYLLRGIVRQITGKGGNKNPSAGGGAFTSFF